MWSDHTRGHVLRHVEAELVAGRLHVGDRLPGERALAAQLGISRPSVREGIRVLEAMGVIRTAVGSGPDAGAVVVADTSAGITSALRLHLAASTLPVADLVRTRVLLESWAVEAAARHRDPEHLAAARALLAQMDQADDIDEFLRLDGEFHVTLSRAAGNAVVAAIMTALRGAIHDYVRTAAATSRADWPPMARRLRRQHRNVLAAIESGDGARAARLVDRHIEDFYRTTRL
jgi:GntR family transcriptional repressor for pyruvate dehydrogenase complex